MKYGLLTFPKSENSGDAIQSIAAMQFLPRVDMLLDREGLNRVAASGEAIAVIGNAWYAHNVENWPPSASIRLLPISVHMSPRAAASYFSAANIGYLRSVAPIGGRDEFTRKEIASRGVDAYMSGCLTLTLENPAPAPTREAIVVCDVGERAAAAIRKTARHPVVQLTHNERAEEDIDGKFLRARRLLLNYAQAKCLVTTRLHAALPALAFGTPVYLIEDVEDAYRFDGLREHLWHGSEDDFLAAANSFDVNMPPANPGTHLEMKAALVERVQLFLADCAAQQQDATMVRARQAGLKVVHDSSSIAVRGREENFVSFSRDMSTFGTNKDGKPGESSQAPSGSFEAIQRAEAVQAAELAAARARADLLRDEIADLRRQIRDIEEQLLDERDGKREMISRSSQLLLQIDAGHSMRLQLEAKSAGLKQELEGVKAQASAAEAGLAGELEAAHREARAKDNRLADLEQSLGMAVAGREAGRASLHNARKDLEDLGERARSAEARAQSATTDVARLQQELAAMVDTAKAREASQREAIVALEREFASLLDAANGRAASRQNIIAALEGEVAALRAELAQAADHACGPRGQGPELGT